MSKAKLIYIESALLSYSRIVDETPGKHPSFSLK